MLRLTFVALGLLLSAEAALAQGQGSHSPSEARWLKCEWVATTNVHSSPSGPELTDEQSRKKIFRYSAAEGSLSIYDPGTKRLQPVVMPIHNERTIMAIIPFKIAKENYSSNAPEQIMINLNTLALAGMSGGMEIQKASNQTTLFQTADQGRCTLIEPRSVAGGQ